MAGDNEWRMAEPKMQKLRQGQYAAGVDCGYGFLQGHSPLIIRFPINLFIITRDSRELLALKQQWMCHRR